MDKPLDDICIIITVSFVHLSNLY